jgi:hypothetical protein
LTASGSRFSHLRTSKRRDAAWPQTQSPSLHLQGEVHSAAYLHWCRLKRKVSHGQSIQIFMPLLFGLGAERLYVDTVRIGHGVVGSRRKHCWARLWTVDPGSGQHHPNSTIDCCRCKQTCCAVLMELCLHVFASCSAH